MNGYFDRLGDDLRLATELRYGPKGVHESSQGTRSRLLRARRHLQRFALGRVGRWPRLGVFALLALSGSAAAAAIPLLGGSHGLAGRVPQAALTSPRKVVGPAPAVLPDRLPDGLRYAIPVTPDLEAGNAGWCSYPAFFLARSTAPLADGGGACAPASAGSIVIVAGAGPLTNILGALPTTRAPGVKGALRGPAAVEQALRQAAFLNWFVVRDRVAMIRVGSALFVPQPDSELAPGWRAVTTFTRGPATTFRYLDHRGHPVNQGQVQPLPPVPITTINPRHVPSALCTLGPSDLPGLSSEWEVVANTAPSRGPLVDPNVLFSCARAWYAFPRAHAVYSAAILLNAQDPARRAPNLPGLTPSTRPGDYEEATGTAGQTTARRIGNAWLLIQGPRQQLREALLHNIAAAGAAIKR